MRDTIAGGEQMCLTERPRVLVRADIEHNTMADQLQLRLPPRASLLHFALRLDVVASTLEAVETWR